MSELAQSLSWGQDESELVTRLQEGSDAAFDWLVTYYHANVYNLVYGILSDPSDAADVTQEVFIHAFRGIRGFRRGSSLKTWLYRISVRQALNHRRWFWRHHRNQVSIDSEESGLPRDAALAGPGSDALRAMRHARNAGHRSPRPRRSSHRLPQRRDPARSRRAGVRRDSRSPGSFRGNREIADSPRPANAPRNSRPDPSCTTGTIPSTGLGAIRFARASASSDCLSETAGS